MKNIHRNLALAAITVFVALVAEPAYWAVRAISNTCSTCYVDYENGCDTNDGTQQTQTSGSCPTGGSGPWKHAPGMEGKTPANVSTGDGCASNCAAQVPVAGDKYILKGGVVWPYTAMPWAPYTAPGGANGSGSTSLYGCQGSGCIYWGNAVGAGLPAWNKGIVTSVTLTRDFGGWNSASPPTVTCTGGGGSGVTVVLGIIPSTASEKSGFIYHTSLSNQGSGYTSAPTCTVPLGANQQTTFSATIDDPIMDMGATQASPPDWPISGSAPIPYCGAVGNYSILYGVECRNVLVQAYTGSYILSGFIGTGNNGTVSHSYMHGVFVDCVQNLTTCPSGLADNHGAIAAGHPYLEVANNTVENGDSFLLGTPTLTALNICGTTNQPCIVGAHGIQTATQDALGPVSIHGNYVYSDDWQIRLVGNDEAGKTDPYLEYGNELWLTLYDMNPTAHINRRYSQFDCNGCGSGGAAELIAYNNIDHDHVLGSGNQQQCQPGAVFYFFNEVIWGTGTSTYPYGINTVSPATGGCSVYILNDTLYNPTSAYLCLNSNATAANTTTIVMQNLHCITGPSVVNPFWGSGYTNITYENYPGVTTPSVVQAASVVQGISTANAQGYLLGNLYAPTVASNSTVTFATGGTSANLTSICTGYLAPLCSDINGVPRPATGTANWQAGAYVYGGTIPQIAAPAPGGIALLMSGSRFHVVGF